MEWSLPRNAKKTQLNTSHRLSGVQAHTCDPAGPEVATVALTVTPFSCFNGSTGISALASPRRIFLANTTESFEIQLQSETSPLKRFDV